MNNECYGFEDKTIGGFPVSILFRSTTKEMVGKVLLPSGVAIGHVWTKKGVSKAGMIDLQLISKISPVKEETKPIELEDFENKTVEGYPVNIFYASKDHYAILGEVILPTGVKEKHVWSKKGECIFYFSKLYNLAPKFKQTEFLASLKNDDLILVANKKDKLYKLRHFKEVNSYGQILCWAMGATSKTTCKFTLWKYAKPYVEPKEILSKEDIVKSLKKDEVVYVKDFIELTFKKRYFKEYDEKRNMFFVYYDGKNSVGTLEFRPWEQARTIDGVDIFPF